MHPARIAELLAPFLGTLSANGQRPFLACPERSEGANAALYQHISTYIDILLRWNARINLTAIRDPEAIVTRHFGESLFAARHLFPSGANVGTAALGCPAELSSAVDRVADLGSGAGFPGLPIKLWAPQISLTLIESSHKKSTFLREVARALTLTDVNILTARAQDLPPARVFDVVTLRAVERFAEILPTAATLVAPAGRLALLIGTSQLDDAHTHLPSFTWHPPVPVPQSRSRTLIVGNRPPRH
jgi:16S rRNA (guanine527-N7)-methyltransferase